jgi:hypothetical protein
MTAINRSNVIATRLNIEHRIVTNAIKYVILQVIIPTVPAIISIPLSKYITNVPVAKIVPSRSEHAMLTIR